MSIEEIRDKLLIAEANRAKLQEQIAEQEKSLDDAIKTFNIATETQAFVHQASQMTLSNISVRINTIVTKAIKAVLPTPYDFKLDFKIAYGKLAVDMWLEKDGYKFYPKRDSGDGLVDLIAMALRIAVIVFDKRNLRRILILDEPCGALSVDYQQYMGDLLHELSERLNLKIVMVASHGSTMEIENANVLNTKDL